MLKVDEEEGMLHSHLPFILSGDPARIATPYSLQILHPHSPGPHYEGTCTPQECGGGGISCILTQGPDIFQKKNASSSSSLLLKTADTLSLIPNLSIKASIKSQGGDSQP